MFDLWRPGADVLLRGGILHRDKYIQGRDQMNHQAHAGGFNNLLFLKSLQRANHAILYRGASKGRKGCDPYLKNERWRRRRTLTEAVKKKESPKYIRS